MLNRSASLAMSTSVLKALPGKFDIKRHSPCILYLSTRNGPRREKTCLRGFANNTGADQPLLFAFWKVSYMGLLQVKFKVSS